MITDSFNVHDEQLASVVIDWPNSFATLHLGADGARLIEVAGLKSLHVWRLEPWGPSDLIYDSEFDPNHPLGAWLMLRMQTGDYFEIVAASIQLRGTEPRPPSNDTSNDISRHPSG